MQDSIQFRDEQDLQKTEQKINCKKNKTMNTKNRCKVCWVSNLQLFDLPECFSVTQSHSS